ncbi:MAG: hypothetical protein IKK04_07350 [Bacteroidales bacterium]|nr:hypothetical protein [Bacteroidales bacterium]
MNNLNGIYVGVKEKEYTLNQIDNLCQKYRGRYGDARTLFRNYCHDTIAVLNDCFDTSLLGITQCINKVKRYQSLDSCDYNRAILDIVDMLINLKGVVNTMVPIKDLPSCKELIKLSAEDIISKEKDLVKNDIIKTGIAILSLGSKVGKIIHIEDVKRYYTDSLDELQNELQIKGETISPIEQLLLDKYKAEIGYCNLAMIKAGLGVIDEVKGLAETAEKDIEKYENKYLGGNSKYRMRNILKSEKVRSSLSNS